MIHPIDDMHPDAEADAEALDAERRAILKQQRDDAIELPIGIVANSHFDDKITLAFSTPPVSLALCLSLTEAREVAARLTKAANEIDRRNMTAADVASETRERR